MKLKHPVFIFWFFFLYIFVGPVTSSFAGGHTPQEKSKTLRLGLQVSDMGTFDPHRAAGSQDRIFADMVFNGLLRYKPGEFPEIEPDLAAAMPEFEMEGSKQVWTISLKKNIMFHSAPGIDSYELTAEDVHFSLQKSAHAAQSAYAGDYLNWDVSIVDRYTLTIVLPEPLSPILFYPKLSNYAGGFVVSKKAMEAFGYEGFIRHPVGTGPFKYTSYTKGKKLSLTGHKHYFRGKPLLEGVDIYFYPDVAEREKQFLAGSLDVISGSGERGWQVKMEKNSKVLVDKFGVGEVLGLFLNTASGPLSDIRVRKAIVYALDRDEFMKISSERIAQKVYSSVPAMVLPGGLTKKEVEELNLDYEYNLGKAKHLLKEAGYPDGEGISFNLVASERRLFRLLYNMLKEKLSHIGITCNIEEMKHTDMHAQIRKNPQDLVIYGAWRPNADVFLTRFFHSESIIVTGKHRDTNFSHYGVIDKLIEDARTEIDPQKQINLWKQAQIRILSDVAAYPLFNARQLFARKKNVDYGHVVISTMALYPQFTEKTHL